MFTNFLKVMAIYVVILIVLLIGTTFVEAQERWGDPPNLPTISEYYPNYISDPYGSLGSIIHFNSSTDPNAENPEYWMVQTPYGPFSLVVTFTTNSDCVPACPDTVEMLQSPEGYTLYPAYADTAKQGLTIMYIYPEGSA